MNLQKFVLQFPVHGDFALSRCIDVFHRWIQQDLGDELLIDVSDYSHVPWGPGIILVSHQAIISVEDQDKRYISYQRKQPLQGSFADNLSHGVERLVFWADQLANDLDGVQVDKHCLDFIANDRLLAGHDQKNQLQPDLERLAQQLYKNPHVSWKTVDQRQRLQASLQGEWQLL